ncbi:fimbria/pilus periplasmic chaperone [Methylonatrum kenyense]|uniref:fimbria/pilus periplasmic chaperone n=1 Tax=Methylonatrum kenyense TaxID=455253 RepID=UPI0020C0E74D|nr:fimbria/pilus periplasmic chaperone [Methylonatrum kenyense]MCK8516028.1 fimbria/pilus periplasmic chaperone [Methylonatrum kenyense]
MRITNPLITAIIAAAVLLPIATSQAFEVQPMRYILAPSGSDAQETVRVRNPTRNPLPLEITVRERSADEHGNPRERSGEDDFLVFPPQAEIQPGETQNFRVQYIGPPDLEQSKSYTVAITQLPVERPGGSTGVQVIFDVGTAAHVVPPGAESDLVVAGTSVSDADDSVLTARLENRGNLFALLIDYRLELAGPNGETRSFEDEEEIEAIIGNPAIYPETTRYLRIPIEEDWERNAELQLTAIE